MSHPTFQREQAMTHDEMRTREQAMERVANVALRAAGYGKQYEAVAHNADLDAFHVCVQPRSPTSFAPCFLVLMDGMKPDVWHVELDLPAADETEARLASDLQGVAAAACALVAEIARDKAVHKISLADLLLERP